MKKSTVQTIILVALIFTLGACQAKKKVPSQSTGASLANSSTTANASSSMEDKNSSHVQKESTTNDSEVVSTSPTEKQAVEILTSLKKTFPTRLLPQKILTANDQLFLSAATAQDPGLTAINYYAEGREIPLNDPQLNNLTPIARFTVTSYPTENEASAGVGYIPVETAGHPVDLGYGITGYQDAGAGSVYLSWEEGNWSLTVRGNNLDGEDPTPLAKDIVALLEKESLPAPKSVGQITVRISNKHKEMDLNSVVWQDGKEVYTIQHHDPLQALKMALSLK